MRLRGGVADGRQQDGQVVGFVIGWNDDQRPRHQGAFLCCAGYRVDTPCGARSPAGLRSGIGGSFRKGEFMRLIKTGKMSRAQALGVLGLVIAVLAGGAAWGVRQAQRVLLPTGKEIQPQGVQTDVGSFPVNMALSPDGKWLVVTNTGFREHLSVLSATDGHLVSQVPFNTPLNGRAKTALYVGLAFGPGGGDPAGSPLYVSRGPEDRVSIFTLDAEGKLTDTGRALENPSTLPADARSSRPNFIANLVLSSDGKRCYAVNNMTSQYTDFKGSISILDTVNNKVLGRVVTPGFPYAIAAITKGADADKKVYVSSERDGVVSVLDVS